MQQLVTGKAIEPHRYRGQRRAAVGCFEQYLSPGPPMRSVIAGAHPLPARGAVGVGKGDGEPIETRLMDHQCRAVVGGGIIERRVQPEAALLVSRRRAIA